MVRGPAPPSRPLRLDGAWGQREDLGTNEDSSPGHRGCRKVVETDTGQLLSALTEGFFCRFRQLGSRASVGRSTTPEPRRANYLDRTLIPFFSLDSKLVPELHRVALVS